MPAIFGQQDIGWAGAFTPLIVSANALAELRNLAGMPKYPGQKYFRVDLVTGECRWMQAGQRSGYRRPAKRRRRR